MSTRIKICGLRRLEDVEACIDEAVEMVGFNFWPQSRRYLAPPSARALVEALPRSILPVGVFVGATPHEVELALAQSGIRAVQLHGDEDPAHFAHLDAELWQVFRLGPGRALPAQKSPAWVHQVLLDAAVAGFGGQGVGFDWSQIEAIRQTLGRNVLVAGGLDPASVGPLVRSMRPWGVDVASGVESAPGVKDRAKLRAFVAAVRSKESA